MTLKSSGAPPAPVPSTTRSSAEIVPPSSAGYAARHLKAPTNWLSADRTMPQKSKPRPKHLPPPGWIDPLRQQQPLVSHRWLLRALGITLAAAAACGYLTVCLLFWQGSWQLIFHPASTVTATPASVGLPFEDVRFFGTETGQPQLDGWWIPAAPDARYSRSTILYLHAATGSLSNTLPDLQALHALGINVFAIDYRGYGKSLFLRPNEQTVSEDADAAIFYLTNTRALNPASIVLYGQGLGATIAAAAAQRHPQSPALILENPAPTALEQVAADRRTSLLPVRLLFSDRFDLAPILQNLKTPKLLIERALSPVDATLNPRMQQLFQQSASPKTFAEIPANQDSSKYRETLRRFLDEIPQP